MVNIFIPHFPFLSHFFVVLVFLYCMQASDGLSNHEKLWFGPAPEEFQQESSGTGTVTIQQGSDSTGGCRLGCPHG